MYPNAARGLARRAGRGRIGARERSVYHSGLYRALPCPSSASPLPVEWPATPPGPAMLDVHNQDVMLTSLALICAGSVSPLPTLWAAVRVRKTREEEGPSSNSERQCGVRIFTCFYVSHFLGIDIHCSGAFLALKASI